MHIDSLCRRQSALIMLYAGPTTTLSKKILKIGHMAPFTYLKIILLQYFQFSAK